MIKKVAGGVLIVLGIGVVFGLDVGSAAVAIVLGLALIILGALLLRPFPRPS